MSKEDVATRSNSVSQKRLTSGAVFENQPNRGTLSIQEFCDVVRADAKPRGRIIFAGVIPDEIKNDYEGRGLTLESNEVLIDDATIIKYIDHPKESKGAVIDVQRYNEVEQVINNPTHIYEDLQQKEIIYIGTRDYETGNVLKVTIHPNYKKKGKTYNLAKSIGIVQQSNMESPTKYRKIK